MVLQDYKVVGGWLQMTWITTTKMPWGHLVRGVKKAKNWYDNPKLILATKDGDKKVVDMEGDVPEAPLLILQGQSNKLNMPLSITFENKERTLLVNCPFSEELSNYKNISLKFGWYLDMLELIMYIN